MQADRATLLALAERCEAATGPDREMDAEIEAVARHGVTSDYLLAYRFTKSFDRMVRRWTASLDAALTLVPEGLSLGFTVPYRRPASVAAFDPQDEKARAQLWEPLEAQRGRGEAATAELALCAAALRALAAQAEGGA